MSKLITSALRTAVNLQPSKLPKEISKTSQAWLAAASSSGTHTLPDLPYDYNALEREYNRKTCVRKPTTRKTIFEKRKYLN